MLVLNRFVFLNPIFIASAFFEIDNFIKVKLNKITQQLLKLDLRHTKAFL